MNDANSSSQLTVKINGCNQDYAALYPLNDQQPLKMKYMEAGYICYWSANNMLGLMNHRGQRILQPEWQDIYVQAKAGVIIGHKYNRSVLFDLKGKPLTGLSVSELLDKNMGTSVIDIDGQIIQVTDMEAYFDGLARAFRSGRTYYIDTKGRVFLKLNEGYWGGAFHCDRAIIRRNNGLFKKKTYGFIDKRGKIPVQPIYSNLRDFSDGIGVVWNDNHWQLIQQDGTPLDCYMMKAGQRLPLPRFADISEFQHGYATVLYMGKSHTYPGLDSFPMTHWEELGGWGVLHKSGELTTLEWYNELIHTPEPGIFIFRRHKAENLPKLYGLMDARGNVLIEDNYRQITPLDHGYFAICQGTKWGIADKNGQIISKPKWSSVGKQVQGTSHFNVMYNESWSLLDLQTGRLCLDAQLPIALCNGLAFLVKNNTPQCRNLNDRPVFDKSITVRQCVENGLLWVEKGGHSYLLDYGFKP